MKRTLFYRFFFFKSTAGFKDVYYFSGETTTMFDMTTAIEVSTPGPCGWGGFQCNNDSCIDIDLVNNGYPDCVDNSDEG